MADARSRVYAGNSRHGHQDQSSAPSVTWDPNNGRCSLNFFTRNTNVFLVKKFNEHLPLLDAIMVGVLHYYMQ